MFRIISILFIIVLTKALEPNPPIWPSSVKVIDPNDITAQNLIDDIFSEQGGHIPSCHGQFSTSRYAILFKPGYHKLNVNVGYYTHVMGLGTTPQDTQIQSVTVENTDFNFDVGALNTFWRIAENFYTRPTQTWNGVPNSMLWAVSQASPLRRVVIDGNLQLYQYNDGFGAGYASGGYMADMQVNGVIYSGSQQQFITRNSQFSFWSGQSWNYVFVGSLNAPVSSCSDTGSTSTSSIGTTPLIAEKPFIVYEQGKYYLAIPKLKNYSVGTSNYNLDITKIGFENVYVAKNTDTVSTINQKLKQGLHLVLTPGIYQLTESILVDNANTIVLGLGLANLVSTTGEPCIIVGNVDGVRISGLLLDAGLINSNSLIQWGTGNYQGSKSNPGILQDLFTRVGGPLNPNVQQVSATNMVIVNSGNVILDDLWLWRADHYDGGLVESSQNPNQVGIQVNGDNVIAYGLAVEHSLGDLVQWNGNNGQVFFYQSELPYDVTQANYGDKGYVSYRVNDNVTSHSAYGIGVYSFFRDDSVAVANGISTPSRAGVSVFNAMSVFLNGKGSINHIINNSGSSVQGPTFMMKFKCTTSQ